jgi:hypothetical protein
LPVPGEREMRAVLEGIVYGDDPKITPADRVRAAEQLRQLQDVQPETFTHLLAHLPPAEADRLYDEFLGDQEAAVLLAGDPARPVLSAAVQAAVEARAQALLVERLGDVDADVERRAQALAAELYAARAFKLAEAHDAATTAAETAETAPAQPAQPERPDAPPGGLTHADLWPPARHRRGRRPGGYGY